MEGTPRGFLRPFRIVSARQPKAAGRAAGPLVRSGGEALLGGLPASHPEAPRGPHQQAPRGPAQHSGFPLYIWAISDMGLDTFVETGGNIIRTVDVKLVQTGHSGHGGCMGRHSINGRWCTPSSLSGREFSIPRVKPQSGHTRTYGHPCGPSPPHCDPSAPGGMGSRPDPSRPVRYVYVDISTCTHWTGCASSHLRHPPVRHPRHDPRHDPRPTPRITVPDAVPSTVTTW